MKTVYFLPFIALSIMLPNASFGQNQTVSTPNFNSGVVTESLSEMTMGGGLDAICKPGYQYARNIEGRIACVTYDTANLLYLRGWSPYLLHGAVVYFIHPNSGGFIDIKYDTTNNQNYNFSAPIYDDADKITDKSIMSVSVEKIPLQKHIMQVRYTVNTYRSTGVHWLKINNCSFIPLVSGDAETVDDSDLKKIYSMNSLSCQDNTKYHILGFAGMGVEYVGNKVE